MDYSSLGDKRKKDGSSKRESRKKVREKTGEDEGTHLKGIKGTSAVGLRGED